MSTISRKHSIFTASALFSSAIGVVAVVSIMISRTIMIRNTLLAELGAGYILLTAPVINGLDPSIFYRIMHNLTATMVSCIIFSIDDFKHILGSPQLMEATEYQTLSYYSRDSARCFRCSIQY